MSSHIKQKFKVCSDPKHLAWATWTIMANNPVNKVMYLLFCGVDFIIIVFYAFILVSRIHYSNLNNGHNLSEPASTSQPAHLRNLEDVMSKGDLNSKGISLSFFRTVDQALISMPQDYSSLLLAITIGILGVSVLILMTIVIMAMFIKNHVGLEKPDYMKKGFCLLLVIIQTFLHMPLFDIMIRTLFAFQNTDLTLAIVRYVICAFAIIFFALLMLYLVRVFNICVPSPLIPWCSPISKIVFLNLLIKAALVVSCSFD